ncbi:MAG: CotH kinase family protein, partial [Bacteroidota bacterium]
DGLDDPQGFESDYESLSEDPMFYQWYYPKAENIQPQQAQYIQDWMGLFEDAVFSNDYTNQNGDRYTDLINVTSFTDFLLINELSKNADGYKLSSYLHKDKDSNGGLLNAGPIWDFDQTYGSSLVCSTHVPDGWTYQQNQDGCEDLESMPAWWDRMMNDPVFTNHLACRWELFRSTIWAEDSINNWIDEHRNLISAAIDRNYEQWDDVIGESIWIEPDPIPETYDEEITVLKSWISQRLAWMDANMPGNCQEDVINNIEGDLEDIQLSPYPNPFQSFITLQLEEPMDIWIRNITGQEVYRTRLQPGSQQLDLNQLTNGMYILTWSNGNVMKSEKLLKIQ